MDILVAAAGFAEMTEDDERLFRNIAVLVATIPSIAWFMAIAFLWVIGNHVTGGQWASRLRWLIAYWFSATAVWLILVSLYRWTRSSYW